ncbi:4-alpha-glucanotransferase [Paratractidigestivibacter sp.]|uniref:4-alpha-glucanotransferase n=1 Tax=Paratractidigestivibacter sp. TaxID=2847316 RepID=UPI002AC973B9|nr:4-alpha-glucanotransferase [Paratractidigestivibacter sp.]
MRARHVTSEKEYRTPFGAAQLGGVVTLGIDIWDDDVTFCTLRVWTDAHGEQLIEMRGEEHSDHLHFSVDYKPAETGIVWYSFDIEASDGSVWRYGARPGWTTGEGAFAYGDPPSFQLTVFEPRATQPDWYKNGIVYQIFPDRFARGEGWRELAEKALEDHQSGPERVLVEDWDTPVTYKRKSETNLAIARWDFYGGTLDGICSKLGYLKGLGITVIYLNPIFDAASNHRYDTADYLRIDPMLGDEAAFGRLCDEAAEMGISVVLDGVWNHCGRDSKYFNRDENYPEPGAWQAHKDGADSPYANWFTFNDDDTYAGWWGNQDMPAFRADSEDYHELICGRDGVVRKWLRAGAAGWRMDVADELTDEFIAQIKDAILAEKEDGVLIGEVWEDASNKTAYGKLRQYFEGKELDGVMNYPLRAGLLDYVCGHIGASELASRLEQLRENYPREAFYSCLNLLGSHDRERLFTMLGNAPDPDSMSEAERAAYKLDDGQAGLAMSRLWLTVLLQMTLPGVPCVYYGDELGLEGLRDPFNRGTFPWGGGRRDCFNIVRNCIAIRKTLPVLTDGDFEPFSSGDDVFGFWRRGEDGSQVCVLVNASLSDSHTVRVPMVDEGVSDVVSGMGPKVEHGQAEVFLWPLGTAILHFHKEQRLQAPLERGMGVLCHVTSVPNGGKPGTMGAPAKAFVDWLAAAGVRYWQVLPVTPPDSFGSPYAGLGAFAGSTALLEQDEAATLAALKGCEKTREYQRFCDKNEYWLTSYACFMAIKDLLGPGEWQKWPAKYRSYTPKLVNDPQLKAGVAKHMKLQFAFDAQWSELRAYANERGISIIGDMPMYVCGDSADTWAEPDIFDLDADGYAGAQAGAPGDAFAPEGQMWGNPTYNWDALREQGYGWWLCRFSRAFDVYDYVRLDHFIGFSSYYSIPKGKKASEGDFNFGPGADLFRAAHKQFGPLRFIAEDLGAITPAVRALVAETGIPGMDVVQFSDGDVREGYEPKPETIVYGGTHDNQTLLGWAKSRFGVEGSEAKELVCRLSRDVLATDADVAVLQLQDVLGLDDDARMNVPGVAEGNWSWRADEADVTAAADYLAELVRRSGR